MEKHNINDFEQEFEETSYVNARWFILGKDKQKKGPYSYQQMIDEYNKGYISSNTYVACTGMKQWMQFSNSPLASICNDGLPEIPLECAKSTFAWCLVAVQIIGIILAILYINIPVWIYWIANSIFIILDLNEIWKIRKGLGIWSLWGFTIVPIYLFVRASKVDKKFGYAITYLVAFVISIFSMMPVYITPSRDTTTVVSSNTNNYSTSTQTKNDDTYLQDLAEAATIGEFKMTADVPEETTIREMKTYHIGDEILVETDKGSYSLCITGVSEASDRNQFCDKQADRVIIIDYRYKNISHATEFGDYYNDELHIGYLDFSMYDADGEVLETYPADTKYAQAVSVGHKSSGQMAYALNNNQNYIEAEYHDNMFLGSDFTIILEW